MLVSFGSLSVRKLLLGLFCGVSSCAVNIVVPVFPNSEAEVPVVSDEGWSEVCSGIFIMKVP